MCALTASGQPWCWGGEIFLPPTAFHDSLPTLIGGSVSFVNISSGPFHTCGLTSSGDAYCWGQNSFGQLGTGDTLTRAMPTPVIARGSIKWSAISVGFWHTCALTTDGTPYCWGYTLLGALGNPAVDTVNKQLTPLAVAGGLKLASISAGAVYTCAVTSLAAAYCWGNNAIGQLGDGTDTTRDAPVPVSLPSGVAFTTIAVSRANDIFATTCGLTSSGAAYCWGAGGSGQLGNASTQKSLVPVPVSGGLTFAALAIGNVHVCGVTTAGAVDCWGGNTFGQLGTGDTIATSVPTPVAGGFRAP